jgi:sugar phosphate isomerase/epimerase
MQRALSTHLFVNQRLTPRLLEDIEDAGLPAIEIFCARQHFDYTDPAQMREVASWFAGNRLQLRSLHTPMYSDTEWGRSGAGAVVNIADTNSGRRQEAVDEMKRALEFAERVPVRFAVVHVGVAGEEFHPEKFDAVQKSLEALLPFSRQRAVELLLENIPNDLSTPARLLELTAFAGLPEMRFCFDTGHAHLAGSVAEGFEKLGERVASTHVHDNRGVDDDHLFPEQGTIDWAATLRAFTAAPPEVPLQFELRDYGDLARPLEKVQESFRRLEELSAAREART